MRIIDTHQHLIYPDRFRYSWCEKMPAFAGQAFRLEEYRAAARGTGITGTLFMEVDVEEPHLKAETDFSLELAGTPGTGLLGVIAAGRPERDDFPQYLDSILHPKLKGLRRILHTQPDELSQGRRFGENLARLAQHGLTFDLCLLSRQLHLAANLLRQAPDVQFVLDHCGIPEIKRQALDPWRERIRELAQFPNLACKISGVVAYGDPPQVTPQAVGPFVEHCLECFGWDRVLFGGDWPVCNLTTSLGRWVEIAREIVRTESAGRQAKLFADNAERIYRLKP
jgi:predicted TIM-barrel fold metal-dependent hydrolase